jgi:hypothetical protein
MARMNWFLIFSLHEFTFLLIIALGRMIVRKVEDERKVSGLNQLRPLSYGILVHV